MNNIIGKKIIIGLTGCISCYKIVELIRSLTKSHVILNIIMTNSAKKFVTPLTLQSLSNKRVSYESCLKLKKNNLDHINLTRNADLLLIAPASANFISKISNGLANDLISTICLARSCPTIFVPSMNCEMWNKKIIQKNIYNLKLDKIMLLGPDFGYQACGEKGFGRIFEINKIISEIKNLFSSKLLKKIKILITSGPTYEYIDPTRILTNNSSGKMGYYLANEFHKSGAIVTMITGPTYLNLPYDISIIKIKNAKQMNSIVIKYVKNSDIFISVAAVSDWKPRKTKKQKIKKNVSKMLQNFSLSSNPDVLNNISYSNNSPVCIGFSAETGNILKYSINKLYFKKLHMILGNFIFDNINNEYTKLIMLDNNKFKTSKLKNKKELAIDIISEVSIRYYYKIT